jgi:hypothetical protein
MRRSILCPVLALLLAQCAPVDENRGDKLFTRVPSTSSGIDFSNSLTDSDDQNIIEYLYYYNGGGVGAGDINGDGLSDLYFVSNQSFNKLYLNEGNLTFKDITKNSGSEGINGWKTGVCMADVNGDDRLDIFVTGVGSYKTFTGRNQLLINNGDLTFTDQTEAYGLAFQGFSTHGAFFDYDRDGDLDLYLVNHSVHSVRSYGDVTYRYQSDPLAGDKLYRNELIPSGKTFFNDVTNEAGIYSSQIGYGLSVSIGDLNNDGFPDIFVANDFHENDYIYINQGNGTFRQTLEKSLGHTSRFSMGSAISDINEDGLNDIITLDMLPRDEAVIKTSAGEDNYDIYSFKLRFGYHYQFSRNTLQLGRGVNEAGNPLFTDVAAFAGIEATDWSWSPLVADFNNDGQKDLFITNGISRRPNDLDYMNYISSDSSEQSISDEQLIGHMPSGKVPSMIFRGEGGYRFTDMTSEWMDGIPAITNGAALADLDNDGDLDIVTNNLDEEATIWKNGADATKNSFLRVKLNGTSPNTAGIGSTVTVYVDNRTLFGYQQPAGGWESSSEPVVHFGLNTATTVDSVVVQWPDGKAEAAMNVVVNQVLSFSQETAVFDGKSEKSQAEGEHLVEVNGIKYVHRENSFNSFERERLLPFALSAQGPPLAIGDFNGDGREDFFVGGGAGQAGAIFRQDIKGGFTDSRVAALAQDSTAEDTGAAAFDADGDNDLDLIVLGGGHQYVSPDPRLLPRLYINDGKGRMSRKESALPLIYANGTAVAPADFDGDGDVDVFIGGGVTTGQFGVSPQSYVLINNGQGTFADRSADWLPDPVAGMISDAVVSDVNRDGRPDLVIAGKWMPLTILVNEGNKFVDATSRLGLAGTAGWWNALAVADMDGDGDEDIIAGNSGTNMRLRADSLQPVELFIADIDANGSLEQILTYYNNGVRYPFLSRDQLVKQVPSLKKKYLMYTDYRNVKVEDILQQATPAGQLRATTFASLYLSNEGDRFTIHELPPEAQFSSVHCILPDDVDGDGKTDLLLAGNWYELQPEIGSLDGGYGLVLRGDGQGNFTSMPLQSGFVIPGPARDIGSVSAGGKTLYLVTRNDDSLLVFKSEK